jgi:hypothetical protein
MSIRKIFILIHIFTFMPLCHGFTNDNTKIYDAEIQAIILKQKQNGSKTIGERIKTMSDAFINRPYILFPLGEGANDEFNQRPLYRTDVFDCETFVDTVLALAHASDLESFKKHINEIRYQDGQPNFLTRNHFTHIDWNQSNQDKSYVKNITPDITRQGKPIAVTETTYINKRNWYKHLKPIVIYLKEGSTTHKAQQLAKLQKLGFESLKNQNSQLQYLPFEQLFDENQKMRQEILKQIPQGSIIEIVRPNWNLEKQIGTRLDISHLGFAIWKNDILYFRNASSIEHQVIDIPLETYLKNFLSSQTIKGIHIEKTLETSWIEKSKSYLHSF